MAEKEEKKDIWPSSFAEAKSVNDFDFLMTGKDGGPITKIPKSRLSEVIGVVGESMIAIKGGTSIATAVVLPAGPTGHNRFFDASSGYWKYNNVVLKNPNGTDGIPQGNEGVLYWSGDSTSPFWSISKMQELPVSAASDEIVKDGTEPASTGAVYNLKERTDYGFTTAPKFVMLKDTGFDGTLEYETGSILGWGENLGKAQNFSALYLPKFKYSQADHPITRIRLLLRENTFTGAVLWEGFVDFDGNLNEEKSVLFVFPEIANLANNNIWAEIHANGRMPRYGATTAVDAKFTTSTNINIRFSTASSVVADGRGFYMQLGNTETEIMPSAKLIQDIADNLPTKNPNWADIVIPSVITAVKGIETNIYFNSIIYSNVSLDMLDIDVNGSAGRHMSDKIWVLSTQEAGTFPLTISVSYNGTLLATKDFSLVVSNGATAGDISAVCISDSTLGQDGRVQSPVLKVISDKFNTDALKVTFKGTQGTAPTNNEGRPGWKVLDFTTAGRTFYKFIVSGVIGIPNLGSTYTNNGSTFIVVETNVTSGTGYFSCERTAGTNLPNASGILTKASGLGDTSISYSSYSTAVGNPLWNTVTNQVDFAKFLTDNSISLVANDWVPIHLGINDIFGSLTDTEINVVVTDRIAKMEILVNSIRSAVSGIKVGIAITIPPTISQDAFGVAYYNGQTLNRYLKNLRVWQKALLSKFDTPEMRVNKVFILNYNCVVDRIYNFPKVVQDANSRNTVDKVTRYTNGVHPADSGYEQMGDSLWSMFKVWG